MEKIITYETLRSFTYSNDSICKQPIRGLVVEFTGLGGMSIFDEDTERGIHLAEQGILYIFPYTNPWAWMNPATVALTDEIIDVLLAHYNLPDDLPIISSGGSMGGLSALVYTHYAKRTPAACVANCPVCDLPYHYTERPDLPRTLYSAFFNEEGSLNEALERFSPIHLAASMPDVPYYIFHCTADMAVNKERHSDVFVDRMQHRNVTYYAVPDMGHCQLTPEMQEEYMKCLAKHCL